MEKLTICMTFISLFYVSIADDCKFGKYDLSKLHAFSPWSVRNDNINATYELSLCSKLKPLVGLSNCPDGTAVCARFDNGSAISYGEYSENPETDDSDSLDTGELLVHFVGDKCENDNYGAFFFFKCGKTLGHPKHLGDFPCYAYFEWESYIFCEDLPVPDKEVPCSVMTKDNQHMIDLSPLTKLTGAYLVAEDTIHSSRIYINVCRDITTTGTASDDQISKCPAGVGACQVWGDETKNFGEPSQRLEATDDGARLHYTASQTPPHCAIAPTTTINFRCPQRGGSKDPELLTDFLVACSIEIDWVTEYACPTETIVSDTCQLTMAQHNVDIDLTPLKHAQLTNPYIVDATEGDEHYQYYINVCDSLGSQCGHAQSGMASVCQRKPDDSVFSRSAGEKNSATLRYSDNQLSMVIKNGDQCHTNFRRETTIDFICNKTAVNNGEGVPEFVSHTDCSYFFVWGTKYACLEEMVDDTCSLQADGKRYDLSSLVREKGENWEVITGENENDGLTYYLNVCHDVLNTEDTKTCPQGAAVCTTGTNGEATSLGKHKQALTFDQASNSLRLDYIDGDKTGTDCARKTTVNFFCSPGNVDSPPQLVFRSADDCYHEIEWRTAAACPQSHKTGTDCRVYDSDAGYTFDLNPLKKAGGYSIIGSDGYKYLINVCGALQDDQFCNAAPHDNAAICQIKVKGNNEQIKVASPSTTLTYYDGVLNLTYTDGQPYSDKDHTPRQAQIAFLCDMAAGVGAPEFLEEKEFTYAFEWHTSYACPVSPVECVVTVNDGQGHKQYDLSSLAKTTDNWQVEDATDKDNILKYYINVCRPVVPIPRASFACSPFASMCSTKIDKDGKETLVHGNLGVSETAPTIEKFISGVKLTYTNGGTCRDDDGSVIKDSDGKPRHYQTTIHFDCLPGTVANGPNKPRLIMDSCEYTIIWSTEAACPVDDVITYETKSTNCTLRDLKTDFLFNLEPLANKDGYEVKHNTEMYQLNICGSLQESVCGKFDDKNPSAVCVKNSGGSSKSVATFTGYTLEYSSQGEMTLTYLGKFESGSQKNYVLILLCDRTAQKPVITFDSKSLSSTTFRVQTALACAPQPVSCTVQSADGKEFDLSPLAQETNNWIVEDTRPTHSDLRYHINVCRPVNPTADMTCPGGAVGACQTSTSGKNNFNLGYVQSEPVLSTIADAITLHYDGGDKCHVGKETESYRSTRIIFYCDTVESAPTFESESDTCEYIFIWRTPAACERKIVTGYDCKVTEPLYNNEFDLSPLRKSSSPYAVPGGEYSFLLNVCGNLGSKAPAPCNDANTGACQTGSSLSSPIVAGLFSSAPQYDSGRISLTYTDGKANCHHKYNRSTVIDFVCHHDKTGLDGPHYLEERSDCTYTFEWPTQAACPPHEVTDCTIQSGDLTFDLSRLSRADGNYESHNEGDNEMFILNVCRSLVHMKDQTCPPNSAACRIDLAEKDPQKKYHSIGGVKSQTLKYEVDSETLVLRYDNGETCPGTKQRRSTVILLTCDDSSDALGTPGGHFTINDCEDHFVWKTSAACPLAKQAEVTEGDGSCTVKNPNTGYEFDLSSLGRKAGYQVLDRKGHNFYLNVCGELDSSSQCATGTGSCQVGMLGDKNSVSAGKANARLMYSNGVLSLKYDGGDTCNHNEPRTTYINFVCQPGEGSGVPVFVDSSDDCDFFFDWHTQLACEKEVECSVDTPTGHKLDFSSLIKKTGKYNVVPSRQAGHQPEGLIYLNLCRPLNPIFGTLCPAGSGACLIRGDKKPLSLGRIDKGLTYDATRKQTKIVYTSGDACPSDGKVNITSEIVLTCGTESILKEEGTSTDCQYLFLWETPEACEGSTTQKLFPNCSFYDTSSKLAYDLSSLSQLSVATAVTGGGKYHLQVCGGLNAKGEQGEASCAGAAVCLKGSQDSDGSFGDASHGVFQKDSSYLELTFTEGRTCNDGGQRAVSTIYFYCDRTAGRGQPMVVYDEGKCEVTIRWMTSLICPPEKEECLIAKDDSLFDLSLLSQDAGSWNYTDSDNNLYWLNLCQGVYGATGCPPEAAVCRKSSNGEIKMLGRLDTQQLSVESSTSLSVKFSEGDPDVCSSSRRRRSNKSPSVVIKMTCGTTMGYPVFISEDDDCVFSFAWKSKLACPVGTNTKALSVSNGIVHDERSGKDIDLDPILASRDNREIAMGTQKYLINIGRPVKIDSSVEQSSSCAAASVCLYTTTSQSYKNIGSFSTGSFYMEDDQLEVVFTSPELCEGKKLNVTSTISFTCREGDTESLPEFLYKSSDCGYFFNWDTEIVCEKSVPPVVKPGTDDGSGGKDSAGDGTSAAGDGGGSGGSSTVSKIAAGVGVVWAVIVVCVLALVLHNPQRRTIILARAKRFVLCRRSKDTPIVYSRLNQADAEEMDMDDPFNPFGDMEEETEREINTSNLPAQIATTYHDDSDEDMLL